MALSPDVWRAQLLHLRGVCAHCPVDSQGDASEPAPPAEHSGHSRVLLLSRASSVRGRTGCPYLLRLRYRLRRAAGTALVPVVRRPEAGTASLRCADRPGAVRCPRSRAARRGSLTARVHDGAAVPASRRPPSRSGSSGSPRGSLLEVARVDDPILLDTVEPSGPGPLVPGLADTRSRCALLRPTMSRGRHPSRGWRVTVSGFSDSCLAQQAGGSDGPGTLAPLGSPARSSPARPLGIFDERRSTCNGPSSGRVWSNSNEPRRATDVEREG